MMSASSLLRYFELTMESLMFLVLLVAVVSSRHLDTLSMSDIQIMLMDAIQSFLKADYSTGARKMVLSKLGLSNSRTLESYF